MEIPSNLLPESIVIDRETEEFRQKLESFISGHSFEETVFIADVIASSRINAPLRVKLQRTTVDGKKLMEKMDGIVRPYLAEEIPVVDEETIERGEKIGIAKTDNIFDYLYSDAGDEHPTASGVSPDLKVYTEIINFRNPRPGERWFLAKEAYSGFKIDPVKLKPVEVPLAYRWIARRVPSGKSTGRRRIKPRSMINRNNKE